MATRSLGKKLEEEMACSICLEPFLYPVLLDCGHNFCQTCIVGWWDEFPSYAVCPQCPGTVQPRSFRRNVQLANMVEMIKQLMRDSSHWEVCASHHNPLRYFCAVEKALICVNCMESKEHRGHRVVLSKDAVEEYRDQFLSITESLMNRKMKILIDKLEVEKKTQDLRKKLKEGKQKVKAEFQLLHGFLLEQEEVMVAWIREAEEKIVGQRNEHIARVFREMSSLDGKVRVLERMCHLSVNEFLQDAERILERCREQLKRLDAFLPEPEWKMPDLSDLNSHLADAIKQFRDSLVSVFQQQREKVPVTLGMAHPTTDPV